MLTFELVINYTSDGPQLEDLIETPVITCSESDENFGFDMPNIALSD